MTELPQPVIRPLPGTDLYAFERAYRLRLPLDGRTLVVFPGFTTDGASIPRFLWRVLGHPLDPDYFAPAAGAHDPLYAAELLPRDRCDAEFCALLVRNGVSRVRAAVFHRGVRLFGGLTWRRHTARSIAEARRYCELHP